MSNMFIGGIAVGQLVQISYRETEQQSGYWGYGVIESRYDEMHCIKDESGVRIMVHTGGTRDGSGFISDDVMTVPLFWFGRPVMLKKTIFGKYKFPKR